MRTTAPAATHLDDAVVASNNHRTALLIVTHSDQQMDVIIMKVKLSTFMVINDPHQHWNSGEQLLKRIATLEDEKIAAQLENTKQWDLSNMQTWFQQHAMKYTDPKLKSEPMCHFGEEGEGYAYWFNTPVDCIRILPSREYKTIFDSQDEGNDDDDDDDDDVDDDDDNDNSSSSSNAEQPESSESESGLKNC